ncbi:hypothetical protein GJU43_22535 [Flavobacterium sp. LC2016-23]|uniref:TRAFAC clade GTPase domain-containing protein n=1 Tax=Flavobacterium sp. LC2016-23 TaxID=2666330 RepID=UPI0012AEF224|nr:hypothetical protein [Flavobacterium sp. LC2016-23]MRX42062.1 hypothetical protein [Flavobacterium sp. LC2016-23]
MSDVRACVQAGCNVREDGSCLEGLEHLECPHFYWSEDDEEIEQDIDSETPSVVVKNSNKINVFEGAELSVGEISSITHKYSCGLIVILGDLGCGKTTLLATIFDLFQIGYLKNYLFAGSMTQKGFELRCHLSRMLSGGTKPETERTKTREFKILHIGIKSVEHSFVKHFLLSDISGETIQEARNSSSTMKEQLSIVKLANHIIYIIDGEKLAGSLRASTIMDSELFIQSALDNNIFTRETILNILISKWDMLENSTSFNLESVLINKIKNRFESNLNAINFKKIASRPAQENSSNIDLGFGVEELINDFMIRPTMQKKLNLPMEKSDRFIENYKIRGNE